MFYLRGADAVRQSAECAMRCRMGISAHDGSTGQSEALLRANDMDNSLAFVEFIVVFNPELAGVGAQGVHLKLAFGIVDAFGAIRGGDIVIDDRQREFRASDLALVVTQTFKSLSTGDFVYQMPVYIDQAGAIWFGTDNVGIPDFVVKSISGQRFGLNRLKKSNRTQGIQQRTESKEEMVEYSAMCCNGRRQFQ